MAYSGSHCSYPGSLGSASPSVSSPSTASVAASSIATASFSVFQESPNQPLAYSPPLGTPELQALVDLFIALNVPASMKMDMIQRDFEAHAARTGDRYKTYFVPAAAAAVAASAMSATTSSAATMMTATTITSPSTFTNSPSPIFNGVFDAHFGQAATSGSGCGTSSGSGSLLIDAASPGPPQSSPSGSDLITTSDMAMFTMSAPIMPTQFNAFHDTFAVDLSNGFFPSAVDTSVVTAASAVPSVWATAPAPSQSQSVRRQQQQQPRSRLSDGSSMQILTRNGDDVTHVSSRATRTHEERENTRIVRQRGACASCRRKKTRCSPGHEGSFVGQVGRAMPYAVPAQSGRSKAEAAEAEAAKAAKAKRDGKRTITTTDPIFTAPHTAYAAASSDLTTLYTPSDGLNTSLDFSTLQDSFDWSQASSQQQPIFSAQDLDLLISTSQAASVPTLAAPVDASLYEELLTETLTSADQSEDPPKRPPPPESLRTARLQTHASVNQHVRSAAGEQHTAPSQLTLPSVRRVSVSVGDTSQRVSPVHSQSGEMSIRHGVEDAGGLLSGSAASSLPTHNVAVEEQRRDSDSIARASSGLRAGAAGDGCDQAASPLVAIATHSGLENTGVLDASADRQRTSHHIPQDEQARVLGESVPGDSDSSPPAERCEPDTGGILQPTAEQGTTSTARRSSTDDGVAVISEGAVTAVEMKVESASAADTQTAPSASSAHEALAVFALLSSMAELASSLIPVCLAWTASQAAHDEPAEQISVGSAMVACQ